MFCQRCGKQVPQGVDVCPYCGMVNATGDGMSNQSYGASPNQFQQNQYQQGQFQQNQFQQNQFQQNQYQQGQFQQNPNFYPQGPQKSSGTCVASMVLGICSFVFIAVPVVPLILAIIGLILGIVGMASSKYRLKGMAIAGFVLSLVTIGIYIYAIFVAASWYGGAIRFSNFF